MSDLPTEPGSVIEAKPPGRKKAFRMALMEDGWWQRLDGPFEESGPFRDVVVLFDAGDAPARLLRTEMRPMKHRNLGCQLCGRPESEHEYGTFCP